MLIVEAEVEKGKYALTTWRLSCALSNRSTTEGGRLQLVRKKEENVSLASRYSPTGRSLLQKCK